MANINHVTRFWSGLQLSNGRQTGIRNVFVGYELQAELSGSELKNIITEELTLTEMAHPDIVINPEIFKILRSFLESRGIMCNMTEIYGRFIPRRVTCTLFELSIARAASGHLQDTMQ